MSTEEQRTLTEVMTILEAAEDKDAIEQLAVLVASGNVKGMIGVDLKKNGRIAAGKRLAEFNRKARQ